MGFLAHVHVWCEYLRSERIEEERRFTIEASTRYGVHERAEEIAGFRRFEEHRAFDRAELAATQSTHGALAGYAPDLRRRQQILSRACCRVPVVALHCPVDLGNDRTIDVV